jgi:hypothetical protein
LGMGMPGRLHTWKALPVLVARPYYFVSACCSVAVTKTRLQALLCSAPTRQRGTTAQPAASLPAAQHTSLSIRHMDCPHASNWSLRSYSSTACLNTRSPSVRGTICRHGNGCHVTVHKVEVVGSSATSTAQ